MELKIIEHKLTICKPNAVSGNVVTDCHARLATGGWLTLNQTGFAPVRLLALRLGAHFQDNVLTTTT